MSGSSDLHHHLPVTIFSLSPHLALIVSKKQNIKPVTDISSPVEVVVPQPQAGARSPGGPEVCLCPVSHFSEEIASSVVLQSAQHSQAGMGGSYYELWSQPPPLSSPV